MESFLRRRLAQASGNILGGSSPQKPVSSYKAIRLPDLCSSYYSIADEPFPQVSGFLDDTHALSFLSSEAETGLNSPDCTLSENQTKNMAEGALASTKEAVVDSGLSCSVGADSQSADGSISTRSQQNEKVDGPCNDPTVSTTSLEKSDFTSAEVKNSTFELTQESKEQSNTSVNVTVDLQNTGEKNHTFDVTQELKEQSDPGVNVTVDLQNTGEKSHTFESHESKESPDRLNVTVDISNLDGSHSKTNSSGDNSAPLNTTTEKLEGTIDVQPQETPKGILNSTEDNKIRDTSEANLKVNVTVDVVEQIAIAPPQPSGEIEQSSSDILKPANVKFTKPNTSADLTPPEVPVLKDTTVEIKPSSTELADQVNGASNSVTITKPISDSREADAEISASAFVRPAMSSETSSGVSTEEHHEKTDTLELAEVDSIPSDVGNTSRNSIFCLDDTLDIKSNLMVTSTPIVFGREPRFEMPRDAKPTPSRRLSVINSIEVQSSDELVGVSNHNGADAVQATERPNKVSVNCVSSHITSEPANENKPPTKQIKRQLPQPSSKLCYTKSSLPPRPQSSMNSYPRKTIPAPLALHHPDTSTTLLSNRKSVLMNKGKNVAPVRNTASSSTVKTSMVSSVTGYNVTAVAKPSSSGLPQVKPSGLQAPTRKRLTARTTQSSLGTIQTQPSNKPTTGFAGMRTRNSLLPSVGQTRMNNGGLPSPKGKRIAHAALSTVEGDAVLPAEGAHESGCVKYLPLQEKLENVIQELMGLRSGLCSECKNCRSLHGKLERCAKEIKMREEK